MTAPWPARRGDDAITVRYVVHDERRGTPEHELPLPISREQLDAIVRDGFVHLPGFMPAATAERLGAIVDDLAELELSELGARRLRGNGYYVRDLEYKDAAFAELLDGAPTLDIARALLGPQVRARLDVRVAFEGAAGAGLDWHIHMPAVAEPLPPFWTHPHSVAALVYLDDVGDDEGALVVAPGSHHDHNVTAAEVAARTGAVSIRPRRGDTVIAHGNLWHRTDPTTPATGRRRVLFLGYTAAWMVGDARAIGQPDSTDHHRRPVLRGRVGDDVERELLGDFVW